MDGRPAPPCFVSRDGVSAFSQEFLQENWRRLNRRYFLSRLPPIAIVWSRRLTSSVGMFASRGGPRTRFSGSAPSHREIRLSLPLFERLATRSTFFDQELLNTLAHEMIHQWQFDVLKRRPNHGPDFLRKMTEMNRSGEIAVTTYHSLQPEVLSLTRFAWHCQTCGQIYRRQRNTINPRRHYCGMCRGPLQEWHDAASDSQHVRTELVTEPLPSWLQETTGQLTLVFPAADP